MLEAVKELIDRKEWVEALQALEPFMEKEPMNPRGLFLFGQIMLGTEKQSIAYPIYKLALNIEPYRPEMWINLGKAAGELHFYTEEEACFKRALRYSKEQNNPLCKSIAIQNLGTCAIHQSNPDKAIHWANKALAIADNQQSKVDLGFAYLLKRDFSKGWKNYNAGLGIQKHRDIHQYLDEPEWDGSGGKSLIVYGEQGLGDQILFAGAITDVRKKSKSVILNVNPKLKGLFSRSFILETHGYEDDKRWVREVDASVSMSRIQEYVRDDAHKISGKPYLVADRSRRIQWAALLESMGQKPKVGIAWTGGSQPTQESERSSTLENLLPILKKDVTWISLEYKDRSTEIEDFHTKHGIKIHSFPWATHTKDYDDTAALVAQLDLVISVPTSVVHLAGGLGVPCWCIVHPHSHCFFGLQGRDMPFYDSVELLRRKKGWEPLKEIGERLDEVRSGDSRWDGTRKYLSSGSGIGKNSAVGEGAVLHS